MRGILATAALILLFAVQSVAAPVSHVLGELAAISCCAAHCEHSDTATDPGRCCDVEQLFEAAPASARSADAPIPVEVALPPSSPAFLPFRARPVPSVDGPGARAAPIFLLVRSLRI